MWFLIQLSKVLIVGIVSITGKDRNSKQTLSAIKYVHCNGKCTFYR